MDSQSVLTLIAQPIPGDSAIGAKLIDDPLFDFVDEQMMKIGSLSHGSIQWVETEKAALSLLSERSKDIRLLAHFLQCLHHAGSVDKFILSCKVLSTFVENYWVESYPAPGERGRLPRRKLFNQILKRFELYFEKNQLDNYREEDLDLLRNAVQDWTQVFESKEILTEGASNLIAHVEQKVRSAKNTAQERAKVDQQEAPKPAATAASVDTSSDKDAKQTLLKVADFLSDSEMGIALGLRLRRYAIWFALDSLPDSDSKGKTQLRAPQGDRIQEYRDSADSGNLQLWRQLEQSLTLSPFWIEGHYLSARMAKAMGQAEWEVAILQETQRFVARFPSITSLKFKDDSEFTTSQVVDWLNSGTNNSQHQSGSDDWLTRREEALSLAKEGGVALAMTSVNDSLNQARELRDQFYWRLLSAELLKASQLDALAKEQFSTLKNQITDLKVSEWEPSLIKQLQTATTSD